LKHADFIAVYISEAHPVDEWKIEGHGVCYMQPKTLQARVSIALDFIKKKNYKVPLYVDLMDNNTALAYEAHPERLYVIQNGVIVYQGGPGPYGYKISQMEKFLENLFPS